MTRMINCRFCDGPRRLSEGGICTGCGSDAQSAQTEKIRCRKKCTKCSDGTLERCKTDYSWRCWTCGHTEG